MSKEAISYIRYIVLLNAVCCVIFLIARGLDYFVAAILCGEIATAIELKIEEDR